MTKMSLNEAIRYFKNPDRALTHEENEDVAEMLVHLRFYMNWFKIREAYLEDHPEGVFKEERQQQGEE
jgi:hypothetical protein